MKRIFGIPIMVWLCFAFLMSIHPPLVAYAQAQTGYEIEDDLDLAEDEEEGLVSLDFKDADLKDVLKVFSQQSGLNFVAAKNIEDRTITLYMTDVLVEDALKTLLDANNLGLSQNPGSNILIVKAKPTLPVQTITRVYKIRYYHGTTSPGTFLEDMGDKEQNGGGGWSKIIEPLLSEFGVVIDYVNILIITDVPDRFKLIDQVISEIDRPIPEVMLEVELIETTSNFLKDIGVQWSKEMARFRGAGTATGFPYGKQRSRAPTGLGVALTPFTEDGAYFQYGLLSSTAMSWIMEMLESNANTKFLSKPRILVQDREWAEIKVTADQVVSIASTVKENGDITTKVERMEVGTILRIVPFINVEEGFVSILLEPSISRPVASAFTDLNSVNFIDPQSRSMRTVVMSRDGETIAVGGFITTEDEEVQTKVPWLGDLPLFGSFFRHTASQRIDKELLIFVTPRIVNPTERVEMWMQDTVLNSENGNKPAEDSTPAQDSKDGQLVQPAAQSQEVKAAEQVSEEILKELPFREQEEVSDMNIDLTMQSSSLSTVDLIK